MPERALPHLVVLAADHVPGAAAEHIARVLEAAVAERGVAHWATTGGSAAPGIYRRLAAPPLREQVPWDRVHTWFGDDRYVPYDHPLSNVNPLQELLLGPSGIDTGQTTWSQDPAPYADAGIRIPPDHLHRWPIPEAIAAATGPGGAASAYAAELGALVPHDGAGDPVLDLIVLGVGPDGHILSVFPGSAAWDEAATCVAIPAPTHVEPHVERVSLHPRLVAAARDVLVVTTGGSKADRLAEAWTGDDARALPVRAARLGTATWILDEAAAAELPRD